MSRDSRVKEFLDEGRKIQGPFVRSPYNYDRSAASLASSTFNSQPDVAAQQQFKDECDINFLLARMARSGEQPDFDSIRSRVVDVSSLPMDFKSMMDSVVQAQQAFSELPASIRSRFGNDPAQFVEFFNDPRNQDEAIRLGFATDKREGLPPAPAEPLQRRSEAGAGGKAGKAKASPRPVSAIPEGYKLVPDNGGDDFGEE